jgi:hypothetical protein
MRWLTAALMVAAAAAAEAVDFVHEGFAGSTFPPAGWAVATGGSRPGRWVRDVGGPWGAYAYGSAAVHGDQFEDSWATLSTYEFDLPAQTEVYYCFFYAVSIHGTDCDGRFYIVYVNPPSGYLVNYAVQGPTSWRYWSGHAFNPSAARVKAVWYVFARGRELCGISLDVDRVTVADRDPAAVAPASLGRVKALFR